MFISFILQRPFLYVVVRLAIYERAQTRLIYVPHNFDKPHNDKITSY